MTTKRKPTGYKEIARELEEGFLTDLTMKFWKECVVPYKDRYAFTNSERAVDDLVTMFFDYGSCPSVVTWQRKKDCEYREAELALEVLETVTLAEHSFEVARQFIQILKEKNQFSYYVPLAV